MVAFTYIAKRSGSEWKANRIASEEGPELSAEAADTYALQNELKKISVENSDGGSVQTLLSTINKTTLVYQYHDQVITNVMFMDDAQEVNVGGAVSSGGGGGGGGGAAAAGGGAAAEAKKEEKKEESEEEEDEDMGFSLFD